MKNFIYLIQGQAKLVQNHLHLAARKDCDAIFLTYDQPLAPAVYFPNSTWAQGRNELLGLALEKEAYLYYIFGDDDISFSSGGWDQFEALLLEYQPAIAVPVVDKTKKTPLPGFKYQSFLINDEPLMAFHNQVVQDRIVLLYQDLFDSIHWWAACEIQEILIQTFYAADSIQFNEIVVSNDCQTRYAAPASGRKAFKKLIRAWLGKQFWGRFKDISYKPKKIMIRWRTKVIDWRRQRRRRDRNVLRYGFNPRTIKKVLRPDAAILKQYLRY